MAAPSYHLTNMPGSATPADSVISLIETDLTAAGWTFIEDYPFTQASTARGMRVWKNPSTLNASGSDFHIGLVRNTASPYTYLAVRAFEGWNTSTKAITGAAIAGTNTFGQTWKAVTYGKGLYVAVGSSGAFATSPDGINWTLRAVGANTLNWVGVTYGAQGFLAVHSSGAYRSSDGITWTVVTLAANTYTTVVYGGGVYVLFYGTSALTSTDLTNFTSRVVGGAVVAACYGGGNFLGATNGGLTFYYSSDGITWSNWSGSAGLSNPVVAYGNGYYVAAAGGANTMYVSTTVGNLGTVVSGSLPYTGISGLTWQPGLGWVATPVGSGNQGAAFTSAASPTSGWSQSSPLGSSGITVTTVGGGNGQFVTLTSPTSGQPSAFTSTDGQTWYPRGIPFPSSLVPTSWTSPNASVPGLAESLSSTLAASTAYDVAVLASRSYLAVAINSNGAGTQQFACVAGLFNPAYTDSQATNPPLMTLHLGQGLGSSQNGVSRSLRTTTDYLPYSVAAGPESLPLGQWTQLGVVKEPSSQTLRAARVALAGGNAALGMAQAGYRGLLYDAVCVAIPNASTVKLGDTLTIGATTYYALGQSPVGATFTSATNGACGYFFDISAGS